MAKAGEIYLGVLGSEVLLTPASRTLEIYTEEIIRSSRTASGRLVKDVIATKDNITLSHELLGGTDLTTLKNLYNLHQELSLLIYNTDTTHDSYTVLMEPLKRKRVLLETINGGLWSGVTVELKEV